ncbi:hypothetical protein L3X38_002783 [Prunus dulcis]|uniref:Uncharacterized protein n=1 Tax=Prunus dulcis TaxID=3755 RepID=A0AAD4WZB0_PRUDU|nr:hypothetical protein L3X38_002783 [Prunus dulcis]
MRCPITLSSMGTCKTGCLDQCYFFRHALAKLQWAMYGKGCLITKLGDLASKEVLVDLHTEPWRSMVQEEEISTALKASVDSLDSFRLR